MLPNFLFRAADLLEARQEPWPDEVRAAVGVLRQEARHEETCERCSGFSELVTVPHFAAPVPLMLAAATSLGEVFDPSMVEIADAVVELAVEVCRSRRRCAA